MSTARQRTAAFCDRFGLRAPVLLAPMAGVPAPAPYPVQRAFTAAMRAQGQKGNDLVRIQAWAGQSAALARAEPAGDIVARLWDGAVALLG